MVMAKVESELREVSRGTSATIRLSTRESSTCGGECQIKEGRKKTARENQKGAGGRGGAAKKNIEENVNGSMRGYGMMKMVQVMETVRETATAKRNEKAGKKENKEK